MLQATERIPYETLLKLQRSSSSVPPAQSRGRSSWSASDSQPDPWHETLNPRSLQNSPHKPALPRPRASHAEEEEDWPDLTQLKWEGGATGVVRGQRIAPVNFQQLKQNWAEMSCPQQDLHWGVLPKTKSGRRAGQQQTLPWSVSLTEHSRPDSPTALPWAPQGRALARSTSRAGQQPQQLHSHGSLRQMTQPLRTHISLSSLVVSPKLAGVDQTEPLHMSEDDSLARALIQDEPEQQQLSQPDPVAAAWRQAAEISQHQASHHIVSRSHMTSMGGGRGAGRGPARRGGGGVGREANRQLSSQHHSPPQQPALHELRLESPMQGKEEEDRAACTAARALPNFASPTRSSEAKAQHAQHSVRSFPSRRSTSRQSSGSNPEAEAHQLLRQHSETQHEAVTRGGVSMDGRKTPGNGEETPGSRRGTLADGEDTSDNRRETPGSAAPRTSTFR